MSKSTERHKRESRSKIAELMNVSAETVRKAGTVSSFFADGSEAMASGKYKVNSLYKLAKGDTRVGLHILIEPELRAKLKAQAKAEGVTVQELASEALTKIFWYEAGNE